MRRQTSHRMTPDLPLELCPFWISSLISSWLGRPRFAELELLFWRLAGVEELFVLFGVEICSDFGCGWSGLSPFAAPEKGVKINSEMEAIREEEAGGGEKMFGEDRHGEEFGEDKRWLWL